LENSSRNGIVVMIENIDFCSTETSFDLYGLGYIGDGSLISIYNAQKWLRITFGICIYPTIEKFENDKGDPIWSCTVFVPYNIIKITPRGTYEEVLKFGINIAIDILKQKNNE